MASDDLLACLIGYSPGMMRKLSRFYQDGRSFSKRPERLLQELLAQHRLYKSNLQFFHC